MDKQSVRSLFTWHDKLAQALGMTPLIPDEFIEITEEEIIINSYRNYWVGTDSECEELCNKGYMKKLVNSYSTCYRVTLAGVIYLQAKYNIKIIQDSRDEVL